MSRKGTVGELSLWFAETIADLKSPTIAELTAAVNLTPFLRRGGLTIPNSSQTIDVSDISSPQNKKVVSTFGGDDITIQLWRDATKASDLAWNALVPPSATGVTNGYLVVRPFGGSGTAPAAEQECEVYPVQVASREASYGDDGQWFTATLAVYDEAVTDATITAGS